jgi:hypothetical protein
MDALAKRSRPFRLYWECSAMMLRAQVSAVLAALFAALLSVVGSLSAADWKRAWATLHNERHGFLIAYPNEVFEPRGEPRTDEGRVLVSRDGQAQLLVGAFANEDATTLEAYRDYLLQENYAGAHIDYAPMRGKWFVLSGTMGDREFYERVSFTCGGKLINSWAMIYPIAERRLYNRIVEAVARSYTPGAGRSGECD